MRYSFANIIHILIFYLVSNLVVNELIRIMMISLVGGAIFNNFFLFVDH